MIRGSTTAGSALGEILELFEYNRWANHRLLDAVSHLTSEELTRDLGSSFPSVLETLAHILAAEWVWLSRWRGESPSGVPGDWDLSSFEGIVAKWDEVELDRAAFWASLDEPALFGDLAYRDTRGQAFQQPLWQPLRHVVNHSSYHRGQIVTMLRQLGAEAVSTDLILFCRERRTTG